MKIRKGVKIGLLISSFIICAFLLFAVYSVLMLEATKFEYSMLILFAVTITSFFSVIYHVKTLKYYSGGLTIIKPDIKVFWVGNLLFSIALFCFSLYFLYTMYFVIYGINGATYSISFLLPLAIFSYALLVGVFLAIEASVFYKKVKNFEDQNILDSIDDIKGDHDLD